MNPASVFREISSAVPPDCRRHIVVVGSLAAGYHFFGEDRSGLVHTRDVDCVLEPAESAAEAGQTIARWLLDARWQLRTKHEQTRPADETTPDQELPGLRLFPPDVDPQAAGSWFLELLAVPGPTVDAPNATTRLRLREGHFGLPTSNALAVTTFDPLPAGDLGIRYARPEMMVLARLLEHPRIEARLLSQPFAGRRIKRSNKDLGRVLAIAALANLRGYGPWPWLWYDALRACFADRWKDVAKRTGDGLRALLRSDSDLEEARHTCIHGLPGSASSLSLTLETMRATGLRLLADSVDPLEALAHG